MLRDDDVKSMRGEGARAPLKEPIGVRAGTCVTNLDTCKARCDKAHRDYDGGQWPHQPSSQYRRDRRPNADAGVAKALITNRFCSIPMSNGAVDGA